MLATVPRWTAAPTPVIQQFGKIDTWVSNAGLVIYTEIKANKALTEMTAGRA